VSALHEFCLDLALRYFISFIYNLNGFMEPLRTDCPRGLFVSWVSSGETQGPFANLMLRSG
jgi:hypothetical protein